jgi:hypothetical protein
VLSSIATAGWNHVIDMIPARDPEEFRHFSEQDKEWFRRWLDWADENRDYLRNTRTILGQPAVGKVDGTSALVNGKGYLFLFNPNFRNLSAEFLLDESIGLNKKGRYLLKEVYPLEGRLIGKSDAGVWSYGDEVSLPMDGTSALVVEIYPASDPASEALLFNVPGNAALADGVLSLSGVRGEIGTELKLFTLIPKGAAVKEVRLNGKEVQFEQSGELSTIPVRFAGRYFGRSQQVGTYDPSFAGGGTVTGSFTIPAWVFEQLAARKKAWPIPWTKEDLKTTWLAPERLLLFVQIAEPDDAMDVRLRIDGQAVELKNAYSAVRTHPPSFVGFYADVSSLQPDKQYRVELSLPPLKPGQFQGLFFDNVETEWTEQIAPR